MTERSRPTYAYRGSTGIPVWGERGARGLPRERRIRYAAGVRAPLAAILAVLLWPLTASADATVVVRLSPATVGREATVILSGPSGVVGTCRTSQGTCTMRGVPGGRYEVSARSDDGQETAPRPVMLPPDGEVRLIVVAP